jgi:hypothetical protein
MLARQADASLGVRSSTTVYNLHYTCTEGVGVRQTEYGYSAQYVTGNGVWCCVGWMVLTLGGWGGRDLEGIPASCDGEPRLAVEEKIKRPWDGVRWVDAGRRDVELCT